MRFSFSEKIEPPRWVDDDRLRWTPDEPLEAEPRAKSPPRPRADLRVVPTVEPLIVPSAEAANPPEAQPAVEAPLSPPPVIPVKPETGPAWLRGGSRRGKSLSATRALLAKQVAREPAPQWLWRLGIGLAQGIALALWLLAHGHGLWPARDPYLFTALLLAIPLAPLALLEGLGEIEPPLLWLWSGTLGFVLATLGLWQQGRGGLAPIPVAAIAVSALLAHATLRAVLRQGFQTGTWFDVAWTVAGRLLVWAAVTAPAFLVLALGSGMFSWLKLVGLPLLGLVSGAGFALAADGRLQRLIRTAPSALPPPLEPMRCVHAGAAIPRMLRQSEAEPL